MCGRFASVSKSQKIAQKLGVTGGAPAGAGPRYNIAPGQPVEGICARGSGRVWEIFDWGLVPPWTKDPSIGGRMINARAETADQKPSFRGPLKNSRCLIPVDGFYEWRRIGGRKQPYFVRLKSREPFALGGLWSHWIGRDGSEIYSCAILTTAPNGLMAPIHDRMPVIIPDDRAGEWLDHSRYEPARLAGFFVPFSHEEMEAYPVSPFVNSPANNSAECVEPAALEGAVS